MKLDESRRALARLGQSVACAGLQTGHRSTKARGAGRFGDPPSFAISADKPDTSRAGRAMTEVIDSLVASGARLGTLQGVSREVTRARRAVARLRQLFAQNSGRTGASTSTAKTSERHRGARNELARVDGAVLCPMGSQLVGQQEAQGAKQ